VKLAFAIATSVVFVALLPMGILSVAQWAGIPIEHFVTREVLVMAVLEAAGITLVAFWCACVVKGTIQATLWVFPICFAIGMAGEAGSWALGLFDSRVSGMVARLVAWWDPVALIAALEQLFRAVPFEDIMTVLIAALVAVGLIQTLRAFRAQLGANKLRMMQAAAPLMLVTFLWGAGSVVFFHVLRQSWLQSSKIMHEVDRSIAALQAQVPGVTQVQRASVEDLGKAAPLSDQTRRWLRDANVVIARTPDRTGGSLGPYIPGRMLFPVGRDELKGRTSYMAHLRRSDGKECSMMFQMRRAQTPMLAFGYVSVACE
jgi:hypothetical protein